MPFLKSIRLKNKFFLKVYLGNVMYIKILFLLYFIVAIVLRVIRFVGNRDLNEWIPKEYLDDFKEYTIKNDTIFSKGDEIPLNEPTILIIGKIRTTNKMILFLDFLSDIFTFGFIRFNEIISVGEPAKLRLYFKNISKIQSEVSGRTAEFQIIYPDSNMPSRNWKINMTNNLK